MSSNNVQKEFDRCLKRRGLVETSEIYRAYRKYWLSDLSRGENTLNVFKQSGAIKNLENRLILDCGCGSGGLCEASVKEGAKVIGVDTCRDIVTVAKNRSAEVQYVIASGTNLPFVENIFDIVFAVDVLEHVYDQSRFVMKMFSVLKQNGLLLSICDNKLWWWEGHTQLPLLHLLPIWLADALLKVFRRDFVIWYGSYDSIRLPTYRGLRKIFHRYPTDIYSTRKRLVPKTFSPKFYVISRKTEESS